MQRGREPRDEGLGGVGRGGKGWEGVELRHVRKGGEIMWWRQETTGRRNHVREDDCEMLRPRVVGSSRGQ